MNTNTKSYLIQKERYGDALKLVLVSLQNRKRDVGLGVWLTIVNDQKDEIILNPSRYLKTELSLQDGMIKTVESVFHDFLIRELLYK